MLCGAGISAPPPSSIPSWWGFNETVLNVIRSRYIGGIGGIGGIGVPTVADGAVASLHLDQIGVETFSQVVTDAFAGATWFRLLRYLDSDSPNSVHHALADLAGASILKAVVTTNFDSLLERAFAAVSETQVVHALRDSPSAIDDDRPLIVKLHGSATKPTTLVDLATQKSRGLPEEWLAWLAELWVRHAVLVLGFSGADTSFGRDYLRLREASSRSPWLRWNIRSPEQASRQARDIVGLYGDRGGYLVGDLPPVLEQYGIDLPRAGTPSKPRHHPLSRHVERWLDANAGDAGACGIVVARMLLEAGQSDAEQTVLDALRLHARRQLQRGIAPAAEARMALVLAQVAHDTADRHPRRAIADLDLATTAYESVVEHLGGLDALPPRARRERALVMCTLRQSRARAHLNMRQHRAAERWSRAAEAFFDEMSSLQRQSRQSAAAEIRGVAAYYRQDWDRARLELQLAEELARATGRTDHARAIAHNLARIPQF